MTDPATPSARDLTHAEMAVFAHELRGALTVVAGYTGLLRHDLTPAEKSAALDGIDRAVARADTLCADTLAGRPPSPERSRVQEPVDLAELAGQAAADQHTATGRQVLVRVDGDGPFVVRGDGQALARVLTNLVGNADKYSPSGSAVEVCVERIERPFLGPAVISEVADRGAGIPAEMRDRIFEPFERLTRDEEKPGTGLGLAVVRNVVSSHDGSVAIRDRDGGGTIFRVELPAEL